MSWNPLKKITRHGSKSHLMQGDESLHEKHVSKIEQLESSTKKLCKDSKKYIDVILQANEFEKMMATDLSKSLLCEDAKLRCLFEEWYTFISGTAQVDDNLILVIQPAVIEPLKKFQGVFSEAREAIKKREQILQECGKYNQKVRKLQEKEKTGPNIVKLESAKQSLANLEEDFNGQDIILRTELPQLYEGRVEYFQPCLEALIKSQVEHSYETDKLFNQTITCWNNYTLPESEFLALQTQRLSTIQALSIVADK